MTGQTKTTRSLDIYLAKDNTSIGAEDIEHRFGFHKATIEGENATLPLHRDTRLLFRNFAETLDAILPNGRAKSVAFTELETASMWAHKAIAELAPAIREEPEAEPKTQAEKIAFREEWDKRVDEGR